jgi:Protein of unknown function (DUF2877)
MLDLALPPRATHRACAVGARLAAQLSADVPTRGRVHSVFARAINLEREDGSLLTLHSPGPLAAPFAIALATWGEDLAGGRITLDLSAASRRDLCISPAREPAGAARAAVAAALEAASAARVADGLGSARGLAARAALSRAIGRRDSAGFLSAAGELVGLGEGLTPAGDDYLVGALAILHRLAGGWPVCAPSPARALAAQAHARTTTVGAAFLAHSVAGEFSEPLRDLVMASSADAARVAAGVLARMGATSGADTLAGMRAALDALADGRP